MARSLSRILEIWLANTQTVEEDYIQLSPNMVSDEVQELDSEGCRLELIQVIVCSVLHHVVVRMGKISVSGLSLYALF